MGNTLEPRYILQEAPLGTSQYSGSSTHPPADLSQTFANPMYPPSRKIMNDQSYETWLSIQE